MSNLTVDSIIKVSGECFFTEGVQMKAKHLLKILKCRYLQGAGEKIGDLFVFLGCPLISLHNNFALFNG